MPTVEIGKFGVYWALDHAIKLAPGGVGGPIKIAMREGEWKAEEFDDTQEGAQYVADLEEHIAKFARSTVDDAQPEPVPLPPSGVPGN